MDSAVIRHTDTVSQPWRNGGGMTREIATWPPGAHGDSFSWRVSVADIDAPGPFSRFPGIDRNLTLIDGESMVLIESEAADDEARANPAGEATTDRLYPLSRWTSLEFEGEASIRSALPTGPTRDFNLMWRRGLQHGSVEVLRHAADIAVTAGSAVIYVAAGSYRIGATLLHAGDTLVVHTDTAAASVAITLTIAPMTVDAVLILSRIVPADMAKDAGKSSYSSIARPAKGAA